MTIENSFISKININNFRNYNSSSFNFDRNKRFIIITGENGSGKTNILEAISLFSPGKGLRKAENIDLQNFNNKESAWGISIDLNKEEHLYKLGTGIISPTTNKRILKINGEIIRSRSLIADYLSIIWLTPQIDKIFLETKHTRRKYFDKMMVDIFPEISKDFFIYDKAMKERNRILKEKIKDTTWLLTLEKQMIDSGLSIAIARIDFCKKLNKQIQLDNISEFPKGHIEAIGDFEHLLKTHSNIDEIKKLLFNEFLFNRPKDALNGKSSVGVHRSDFNITYIDKNMPANLCSTGEQKALLISTFLSFAHEMKKEHCHSPIILLDELVAHLDENRKRSLFLELEKLSSQVFMTGTDKDLFEEIENKSFLIEL